jgi:transposase
LNLHSRFGTIGRMKAYSQDLRDRIVTALKSHTMTREQVAQTFGVSRSFAQSLWRRWRDTGSAAAQPHSGGRPRTLAPDTARIRAEVKRQPDATLAELCERVHQAGGPASSPSMMCRELQRLDLRRKKKTLHASQRDTPRVRRARQTYRAERVDWVAKHLKFIDESSLHASLTRLYGRAEGGQRVEEAVPYQPDESWTMVATLGEQGVSAPWVLEGALNGAAFDTYVQQVLAPTLEPGDIVIVDGLPAHKGRAAAEAIQARGARLQILPPYSPDLNPIELCWAKIKTALRAAKARTLEAVVEALKVALESISAADAIAWMEHCGYCVHP